ncbi:MAG: DegV family protein [Clostridia bacterium]|nr:DegV family protein [Clostridia bacterium]
MFRVFTDTSANVDVQILKDRRIGLLPFTYHLDGKDYTCTDTSVFDGRAFYDAMRGGAAVTTSQITPQTYIDCFTPVLQNGEDVLFVSMSSGVSGSYQSAQMAREELLEHFPDRTIRLVDTIGASLGEGLLAIRAAELRDAGKSVDETADELLCLRHSMCNLFTVDNLKYLRASGRLSRAMTVVGSVLQIKPILQGDKEGKIISFDRTRGRKKAIQALAEYYDRYVENADTQCIGISHADCESDADELIALLKRNHPPKEILKVMFEPVTGSHVGPGTLALFFLGDSGFRE